VRLERAPQHIVRHGPDEIGFVLKVVWHEEPLSVECMYKIIVAFPCGKIVIAN
jgi:hypothetical protein